METKLTNTSETSAVKKDSVDNFINNLKLKLNDNKSFLEPCKELHWTTLIIALIVAFIFFIPFIINGKGYFLFYGDFNVQQVPFYQLCHKAVKTGNWGWNWNTDLGVNFIGSYTFYLLGSPFFWLTIPFPNSFVPHLMGPLLILKFGCAAFTAYFYIRRFVKRPESACLGSLLYAFSGFSVYNIFFNHFHEAIVLFPLLLLSIEMNLVDKKRGPFAVMVAICALCNYFFFYGMVVFSIIYFIVRAATRQYKLKVKDFVLFVFEAVIGFLISMVFMLPTVLAVTQNSRVSSVSLGYGAWLYGREQIYANILQIFFFPPDIPARPVFFPGADIKWSSMGAWLPLFSMVGVFAWFKSKEKHWIKKILGICLFMALVPILNSAFYMFNSAYYARWFYMPILLMCLCSMKAVEDKTVKWRGAFILTSAITVCSALVIGFWPEGKDANTGKFTHLGIYTYEANNGNKMYVIRYWITVMIAVASLIILGILLKYVRRNFKLFMRSCIAFVCLISITYACVFIACGSSHSDDIKNEVIPNCIEGTLNLDGNKDEFRIDCMDCMDNTGMFLGYSCINAFHSIVPGSVMDFYPYIGEERSVGSRPTADSYAIRPLLSVKYLLMKKGNSLNDKMPGYTYVKQEDGFEVYRNDNYIPFGFTYDHYITETSMDAIEAKQRSLMMLKAICLNSEQEQKYGSYLSNITTENYKLDKESMPLDCQNRNRQTATNFVRTKKGFTCNMNLDSGNLVFFSVPFEKGWSAKVDGVETSIEKVNKSFMAVFCETGSHEIEFVYHTPGLKLGGLVTIGSLVIFAAYVVLANHKKTKKFFI